MALSDHDFALLLQKQQDEEEERQRQQRSSSQSHSFWGGHERDDDRPQRHDILIGQSSYGVEQPSSHRWQRPSAQSNQYGYLNGHEDHDDHRHSEDNTKVKEPEEYRGSLWNVILLSSRICFPRESLGYLCEYPPS